MTTHCQKGKQRLRDSSNLGSKSVRVLRSLKLNHRKWSMDSGPSPWLRALSEATKQTAGGKHRIEGKKGQREGEGAHMANLQPPQPDCHGSLCQQALSGVTVSKWGITGPKDSATDTHLWEIDLNFHTFKCFTDLQNKAYIRLGHQAE